MREALGRNGAPGASGTPPSPAPRGPAPAVSIIVPCFNAAATLADTLKSLRAQSRPDWEAICVDDESSDATPALLARFAAAEPRIRYRRVAHGGLAATRNRGLAWARASCVLFLDADDVLRPEALAVLLKAARLAGEETILAAAYELLSHDGRGLGIFQFSAAPRFTVDALLRGNLITQMTLVPRRVLGARPFDETLRACEDWELWLRLADAGVRCATVPRVLFGYRLRSGSLSRQPDLMYASGRRVIERWLPRARRPGELGDVLHRLACAYGAVALAGGEAGAIWRYFADLPALEPADDFPAAVAGSIHAAFTQVHGAAGRTWRENARSWLARIGAWLQAGPIAAHADAVLEHLRPAARGVNGARLVRAFLAGRRGVRRVVVYGLGWNGVSLLEQLRRDPALGHCELCVADDHAAELTFAVLDLPREDPRRWRSWPPGTAVVVTPNQRAAMEATLRRAGGRAGVEFIRLVERVRPAGEPPAAEPKARAGGLRA